MACNENAYLASWIVELCRIVGGDAHCLLMDRMKTFSVERTMKYIRHRCCECWLS